MSDNTMNTEEIENENGFDIINDFNKVLKYNEISLKSFSDHSSNQWREFTIDSNSQGYYGYSNNNDINFIQDKFTSTPYRSGGFNYKKSPLTDGRFIIWRLVNKSSTLELCEHYSHHSLESNQIRIHFNNTSIIGDVFIQELNDYVIIMVTTISKTIYRFLLPHPSIIEHSDSRVGIKRKVEVDSFGSGSGNNNKRNYKSIFSNLLNSNLDNQWSRVRGVLPDSFEPTVIRYYSATKLIIGSSGSGSTWLELSDIKQSGDITVKKFDCKEGQGFFSSWKWGEKQEPVQDIQFLSTTTNSNNNNNFPLALILLNNSQLKVWSANDKKFIKEITISPENWNNNNNNNNENNNNNNNNIPTSPNINSNQQQQQQQNLSLIHKRFKIYQRSTKSFLLVVYFQFNSESQFQFFSGTNDFSNGINIKEERFAFLKGKGLIDFNIHNGILYSIWSQIKERNYNRGRINRDQEFDEDDNKFDRNHFVDDNNDQEEEVIFKHIYIGDLINFNHQKLSTSNGNGNGNGNNNLENEKEINMEYNQFYNGEMINTFDKYYETIIEHSDEDSDQPTDQTYYYNLLFNRGLFSPNSIEQALNEYKKLKDIDDHGGDNDVEMNNGFDNDNSLESVVSNILNQEDFKFQSNEQWSIFFKLCTKFQKQTCLLGSGLFIEPTSSIIFLIRSNQLSIMKPMKPIECLYTISNNINNSNIISDKQFYNIILNCFGSNSNVLVNDFLYLMKCCNFIDRFIKDDYRSFEYELSRQHVNHTLLKVSEKLIANSYNNSNNNNNNNNNSNNNNIEDNINNYSIGFIKLFKLIENPIETINLILKKFKEEFSNQNDMVIQLQQGYKNIDKGWSGDLFADILTNCFVSTIEIKYQLLTKLSLLLGTVSNLRTHLGIDTKTLFTLEKSILPDSIKLLSTYYLLNWFTKQNFIKSFDNSTTSDIDKILISQNQYGDDSDNNNNINNNEYYEDQQQQQNQQQFTISKNLNILTILINRNLNQFTSKNEFFENIEKQLSKLLCVLAPHMDLFSMGCYLVEKNQYKQLMEFLQIIENNELIEMITPFYYLMGICYAHYSKFNEAYQYLLKATESIENQNQDMLKICSISKEELVCSLFVDIPIDNRMMNQTNANTTQTLISNYYLKCIKIFETRNQPEFIIQFSLFAIDYLTLEKENFSRLDYLNKLESLYSLVFKYSLKIQEYDLAFTASTLNPNQDVSQENKRRLILTLCENSVTTVNNNNNNNNNNNTNNNTNNNNNIGSGNSIKVLCKLPFPQKDIEDNLLKLASAQDLNKKPDYHTILYAYYISRCNYRNASMIYYERSIRVNIEGLGKSRGKSIFDQQQLLDTKLELLSTTINTLKLLDPSDQWIEINSSSLDIRSTNIYNNNSSLNIANHHQHQHQQRKFNYIGNNDEFKDISVVTLKEIEKEYSYYLASKHLCSIDSQINSDFILSPQQLLEKLIQYSLFDVAFSLAITQEIDLGAIFESFASKCVQLQLNPQSNPFFIKNTNGYGSGVIGNGANNNNNNYGFDCSELQHLKDKVTLTWKVLENYLQRYDSDKDFQCLSPSEINENSQNPNTKATIIGNQQMQLRMFGEIQQGSLVDRDCNGCSFRVSDSKGFYLDVHYSHRVPPFFNDTQSGQQVIVIGKLQDGRFIADNVLCKQGQLRYHELVADTILYEGTLDLPTWLIQWFSKGRQDTLFKLYFRHSRLIDASITLRDLFKHAQFELNQINNNNNNNNTIKTSSQITSKTISLNIPYDLIDRFFIEAKKIKSSIIDQKEKQQLTQELTLAENEMIKYFSKVN
ncbi:hypothetical protein DDB_G0269502 [Dictyostelium discoideum AX4]|uniref:Uncharacterized protein n=1 Tax=Dictyostelium discoideum TaxID=44689 RepID=Q55DW5_DICDI|nr:hypothetical protein DDB_G0269502 [Dictyostelium discoideum AX4]EAL72101.2 hypothetical protein DDB_G0269502 [Dictyostelium discoideum AX4]|eukprot:XP_646016.2 hypothetical protein DDB_G0269502 [Dictyostelium discoideum AX4]